MHSQQTDTKGTFAPRLDSTNKTILIVPDIHHDYETAEMIIDGVRPDATVFLGDYFDDFYDTPEDADNTAQWLKKSLRKKNRIHLLGNHDIHYLTENISLKCSGYSIEKHDVIRRFNFDISAMHVWCWVDDWLCTHAGVSLDFLNLLRANADEDIDTALGNSYDKMSDAGWEDASHPFYDVSYMRSGNSKHGGVFWCDYREFVKPRDDLRKRTKIAEESLGQKRFK